MGAISLPDGAVTLEAIPQVDLDKLWILGINIAAPSTQTEASIDFRFCPWSGQPQDECVQRDRTGNDITQLKRINDLYRSRAECPALDRVFTSIITETPEIIAYMKKREEDEAKVREEQVQE